MHHIISEARFETKRNLHYVDKKSGLARYTLGIALVAALGFSFFTLAASWESFSSLPAPKLHRVCKSINFSNIDFKQLI